MIAPQIEAPLKKVEKSVNLPYTIQLISYKKEELAEAERLRLSQKEINAFVVLSGNWYQVCAGNYRNVSEAKKALEKFAKEYKGCFIRKR